MHTFVLRKDCLSNMQRKIYLGHPVCCMRDVVDESAGGRSIREICQETFWKYIRQKAGCATFRATIIVERLSIFDCRTVVVL